MGPMWLNSVYPVIRSALAGIGIAALSSLLLFNLVASPVRVEGISMVPSLAPHQRLIISPLLARLNLHRSDLVVFNHPHCSTTNLVKRVAALPGDRLCISNQGIFVNKKRISTWTAGSCTPFMDITIPRRHVFVLGDNLNHSSDSRTFGPVPVTRILGKVVLSYWPFSRIGIPR